MVTGRQVSRADAHACIRVRDLESQMRGVGFDPRRTRRLVNEAPGAYQDTGRMRKAQRELTRIVVRLRPVLNHRGR